MCVRARAAAAGGGATPHVWPDACGVKAPLKYIACSCERCCPGSSAGSMPTLGTIERHHALNGHSGQHAAGAAAQRARPVGRLHWTATPDTWVGKDLAAWRAGLAHRVRYVRPGWHGRRGHAKRGCTAAGAPNLPCSWCAVAAHMGLGLGCASRLRLAAGPPSGRAAATLATSELSRTQKG